MRMALINSGSVVVSFIMWDVGSTYIVPSGFTLLDATDAQVGSTWTGTAYTPPPPYVPTLVETNTKTITDKVVAALTANAKDLTQDASIIAQAGPIITQANALAATTGTRTTAQLSDDVRAIAAALSKIVNGISMLAGNDANSKRELQALIRLAASQLDTLAGT